MSQHRVGFHVPAGQIEIHLSGIVRPSLQSVCVSEQLDLHASNPVIKQSHLWNTSLEIGSAHSGKYSIEKYVVLFSRM